MKMKILAAVAFSAACSFGQAQAATLAASSNFANISNFSIGFNDSNGDGLLQFAEVTSFSGVTIGLSFYGWLTSVPSINGISDHDGGAGGQSCLMECSTLWYFSRDDDGVWNIGDTTQNWTYEITGLASVPLPASLSLLAFGIGGLGLMARRKRKVS